MSHRNAFSLMELLVTVGILATLTAILLPMVKANIRNAQAARCVSNLRQLHVSLNSYAVEKSGKFPPVNRPVEGSIYYAIWSGELVSSGVITQRELDKLTCPANTGKPYSGNMPKYAYNHEIGGGNGLIKNDSSFIWVGSKKVIMADGKVSPSTLQNFYYFSPSLHKEADDYGIGFKWHSAGANLLFGDGHVESREKDAYDPSLALPSS